jgi:hypothetical protein
MGVPSPKAFLSRERGIGRISRPGGGKREKNKLKWKKDKTGSS